jgi:tetratricopeptide (TPR) repeat protein
VSDWIWIPLVAVAVLTALYYSRKRKLYKVLGYLNGLLTLDRDPDLFLSEVDGYIARQRKPLYRNVLIILKCKGLIWKGLWNECLGELERVKATDILNDFNRVMFHYDRTFALFRLGRDGEALAAIGENERFLDAQRASAVRFIAHPAMKIFAMRAFHSGDLEEAKRDFEELNGLQTDDFSKAVNHFYLGLIAGRSGDLGRAKEHFERVGALAPNTCLPGLCATER